MPKKTSDHILAARLPNSTEAERRRFLTARDDDAEEAFHMLKNYLEWHEKERKLRVTDSHCTSCISIVKGVVHDTSEQVNTPYSFQGDLYYDAMPHNNENSRSVTTVFLHERKFISSNRTYALDGVAPNRSTQKISAVDILYLNNGPPFAIDSTRICHVMPGLLNPQEATAAEHARRVAVYLDENLSRESMEKITVIVDTRAGVGWANPSPLKILPFIKLLGGWLNNLFPERLKTCIVMPVPSTCLFLYNVIKPFIDPNTVKKIVLLGGAADANANLKDSILKYIDKSALQYIEARRQSLFIRGDSSIPSSKNGNTQYPM